MGLFHLEPRNFISLGTWIEFFGPWQQRMGFLTSRRDVSNLSTEVRRWTHAFPIERGNPGVHSLLGAETAMSRQKAGSAPIDPHPRSAEVLTLSLARPPPSVGQPHRSQVAEDAAQRNFERWPSGMHIAPFDIGPIGRPPAPASHLLLQPCE